MSDLDKLAAENQLLLRIAELLVADGAINLGERDGKLCVGIGHREFEIAIQNTAGKTDEELGDGLELLGAKIAALADRM